MPGVQGAASRAGAANRHPRASAWAALAVALWTRPAFGEPAVPAGSNQPTAEQADDAGHAGLSPIEFQDANDSVLVSVEGLSPSPGDGPSHGSCITPCRLWLPPGPYHVLIENLESKETVSGKLTLKEPERVWVDVGSKSARGVGLGLGIGGAVATLIGFAGFVASFGCATDVSATPAGAADSSASGTSGDCSNVAAHVAWGTFMTGAFVTTVVGFAIRSGATSSIAVVPLAAPAPVATRMWAPKGLGLRFAF